MDRGAIYLLTDYGDADEFAGVVRAVLGRHAPRAPVVDLTHQVPPFDVRFGARSLARAAPFLGPGVVLAVVDPGVGSPRRAVAVTLDSPGHPHALVGPDNGLLIDAAAVLGGPRSAVEVASDSQSRSGTFDGRDVFAPAAAALWRGESPSTLGTAVAPDELVRLAPARCVLEPGRVDAEVLWIDRFGNVQLAARADALGTLELCALELGAARSSGGEIEVCSAHVTRPARLVSAFADLAGLEHSTLGVLVDANGHLSVVCDRASAATVLAVQSGDIVTLLALRRRHR
ncbi:MAG: SAM hydrolase/SAM-dependent halogenase family protein [Acidimicrobiales bacterium]